MADACDSLEKYLETKLIVENDPTLREYLRPEYPHVNLAIKIIVVDQNEEFVKRFGSGWIGAMTLIPLLRHPDPEMSKLLKSYGY